MEDRLEKIIEIVREYDEEFVMDSLEALDKIKEVIYLD